MQSARVLCCSDRVLCCIAIALSLAPCGHKVTQLGGEESRGMVVWYVMVGRVRWYGMMWYSMVWYDVVYGIV